MMVRGLMAVVVAGLLVGFGASACSPQRDCVSVGGFEVGCVERGSGLFG